MPLYTRKSGSKEAMWKVIFSGLLFFSLSERALTSQTPAKKSYDYAVKAIFEMGVYLQALIEEPNPGQVANNFLVSPLSATLIIGQLMIGMEGQFRDELYDLLALPNKEEHQLSSMSGYYYSHNGTSVNFDLPYTVLHLQLVNLWRKLEGPDSKLFNLTASNALFVNSNLKLSEEFVHNLLLYKTYIQQLNFFVHPSESQRIINNWAEWETTNLIRNILASPPTASDAAIFMNVAYFKGDWVTPFSYELSYESDFKLNKNANVTVEYMRGYMEDITYGESIKLGCKMIGLPYKGDEVVMYIFLPNKNNGTEYNIKNATSILNFKDITEFIDESNKKYQVSVQLPKMKLSNRISLLQPLQKYKAFKDEKAEKIIPEEETTVSDLYLNNAGENTAIKVSEILVGTILLVDEKGTEPAAVPAPIVHYSSGIKNFKIDRPFFLLLRHEPTSAIIFWGSIANPIQEP